MKSSKLHSMKEREFVTENNLFVADLSETAKRRFALKQRLAFSILNGLALGTMWFVAFFTQVQWSFLVTLLCLIGCIVLWLLGASLRKRHKIINVLLMVAGWIILGTSAGSALASSDVGKLLTVTCVLVFAVNGSIVDVACFRHLRSPAAQYAHNGIWILAGCILTYLFSDTEWALAFSGLFAILITFFLHASINTVFDTYRSNEYLAAASNVPTALLFRKR